MARIAGINIPQNKLVQIGLTYIYGIGDKFSKQICSSLEIPKKKRVNELTDDEIDSILSGLENDSVNEINFDSKGYKEGRKLVDKLRRELFRKLNNKELDDFMGVLQNSFGFK